MFLFVIIQLSLQNEVVGCKGDIFHKNSRKVAFIPLEEVGESQRCVDGIEREGDGLEIGRENTVQSPVQISVDEEMLIGAERTSHL